MKREQKKTKGTKREAMGSLFVFSVCFCAMELVIAWP